MKIKPTLACLATVALGLAVSSARPVGIETALLLVPPSVIEQLIIDYELVGEHFRVPNIAVHLPGRRTYSGSEIRRKPDGTLEPTLHVLSYNHVSDEDGSPWIEELRPGVIIADECDALKDLKSTRTLRVMRYFAKYGDTTSFCGWTGSLTDNSLREFAHLAALALRWTSPLPLEPETVKEWGTCLDAVPNPSPPGALLGLLEPGQPKSELRRAFRKRLAETLGFVLVEGRQRIITTSGVEVALEVRRKNAPSIPPLVAKALEMARDNVRPDTLLGASQDEILIDILEQAKCLREIAVGVMYKWEFPRGEPRELIARWYEARKFWNQELLRKKLRGEVYLDSPKLCEDAARRAWGDLPKNRDLPEWQAEHWPRWRDIKDHVQPTPVAKRLDPFLVEDTVRWAIANRGIIWYSLTEFAEWVADKAREWGYEIPMFGEGSERAIAQETGERSILASIEAHGRGRNGLQFRFDRQLVANCPASDRRWQQLLGRLHRRGQSSANVLTEVYLHTKEVEASFDQALRRGDYVEDVSGEDRKLLIGWLRR